MKIERQEIYWVDETRCVQLARNEKPIRVWTLYGDGRENRDQPPKLPIQPLHLQGAFLEDFIHDWNFYKETATLRYYSRVIAHSCWILVEYGSR